MVVADLKAPELKITVLGCCGSFPGAGGACSGYLVDDGTTRLWLDAGSGTLANLQRHCALESVDVLVLSHEHPDHWSDVEGLIIGLRHLAAPRGVPVFAPAGLRERTYHPSEPHLDWHVVADGDTASAGTMSLTFSRTDHPVETLAVRIETGGLAVGYSSDTGPGWSLEALGRDSTWPCARRRFLRRKRERCSISAPARRARRRGRPGSAGSS